MSILKKASALAIVGSLLTSTAMADNIAITNGKVMTMGAEGTIEGATVLISGNTIRAVGTNVSIPAGYTTYDAGGRFVTPGYMVAGSNLGVSEVGAVAGTNDNSVRGGRGNGGSTAPFTAAFDLSYAINPKATHIAINRVDGITRAVVTPGRSTNIFGGQGAIIHLGDGWDILQKSKAFMTVSLGERGSGITGGSRASAMIYLRTAFDEAERLSKRGPRTIPSRERDTILSRMDAEALIPVVKGDMPLTVNVSRASDILQVLKLKETYGDLNLILVGAEEAWMVAPQIAAAKVPVIMDATKDLPGSFSAMGSTLQAAGRLEAAGVTVSFAGGTPRLIKQQAGLAVAHGMTRAGAMKALTVNPANTFGIGNAYGTLEAGKLADVVVWDGDPLEVYTMPTKVVIEGKDIELVNRQTKLRDRYMNLDDMKTKPSHYKN